MTNSTIHTNVMRRVRTIHAIESAASGAGASIVLLAASLYFIGREVWVARVWENMPNLMHVNAFINFFTYAFLHTNIFVQVLILITIFAGVWFVREFVRVFTSGSRRLAGA